MESDYQFEITVYSNENLDRITELIRSKAGGHSWDFFDPEDLANKALRKLWKCTILHPDCCRDKEWIDKEVSTIVVRIWIDEVRRELKKRNLSGSGAVCVSLFGGLDVQVADLGQEFEAALRELLEHIKADLTPRQKRIIDLRMEKQEQSDIALKLKISESTIDKEIVSIKKKIVLSMAKISTNDQRPTTNEVATRPEKIVLNYSKIVYASCAVLALMVVEGQISIRCSVSSKRMHSCDGHLVFSWSQHEG